MSNNIKALHLVPSVGPQSFGLGPVVLNYVKEQILLGCDSDIWCFDSRESIGNIAARESISENIFKNFPLFGPKSLSFSPSMEWAGLTSAAGRYDIIHQHGLWTGVSRVSRLIRKRFAPPEIVTPHGMLESWALNRSKARKQLALFLYERKNLKTASCLHACSQQEVAGFREFGLRNPVAVIPNGIGTAWLESAGCGSTFRKRFGIPESRRILLYLSRITPIKGIPMLIEALGSIRRRFSDWVLVIAGADEFGHLKDVQTAVMEQGLGDQVVFTGLLNGQIKRDAFAAAELFVLPTRREAAPVVVPEALGTGLPVITTQGAPWQDLVAHGCGWWTGISSDALAAALQEAMIMSPDELKAMGRRGRALVSSEYSWEEAARRMIGVYDWLLKGGAPPPFVEM